MLGVANFATKVSQFFTLSTMDQESFFNFLFSRSLAEIREILQIAHRYERDLEELQRTTLISAACHHSAQDYPIKPAKRPNINNYNDQGGSNTNVSSQSGHSTAPVCLSLSDLLERSKPRAIKTELVDNRFVFYIEKPNEYISDVKEWEAPRRKKRSRSSSIVNDIADLTVDR